MDANIWTWCVGGNNLPSHFILTEKCEKNEKRLYVKQITTIFFTWELQERKKITLYHDYLNTQISFGLEGGNINSNVKIPVEIWEYRHIVEFLLSFSWIFDTILNTH